MRAMQFGLLLVLFLQILSLDGVWSRHLDLGDGFAVYNEVQNSRPLLTSHISIKGNKRRVVELMEEPGANKEIQKIGSSPPSCEHKCYGCMPCEAIQVPSFTGRVGVQYTNYEPEGWKCKCGPTFYGP